MNPTDQTPPTLWNTAIARRAAWLRLALTALLLTGCAWAFASSLTGIHRGCMAAFGGFIGLWFIAVPLLGLGILSLAIAIALFKDRRWGRGLALIFDVVAGGISGIALVASSITFVVRGNFGFGDSPARLGIAAFITVVVLVMAAEAAWLLAAARGWRGAWKAWAALATLLVAMLALVPLAEYLGLRHLRAPREYIATHFITPPAAGRISVSREPSANGGHRHRIDFSNNDYAWVFFVRHDPRGFRFDEMAGISFIFGMLPQITSVAEAREHLLHLGIPASQLGTNLDVNLPLGEKFVFDAPSLGGKYGVQENGTARLYLSTPLIIPD